MLPATFQLSHHFFLTRLKLVVKQVFTRSRSKYLLDGLEQELVLHTPTLHCTHVLPILAVKCVD